MNIPKIFLLILLLSQNNFANAQNGEGAPTYPTVNLDYFHLEGNVLVFLQRGFSAENGHSYRLLFTDVQNTDSLIVIIDSIEHVPCGGPNSIFFIDDSTGFLFESGGCYAYYNWMYRTADKGHTWKKVVFEIGTELFPDLNAKKFYMFGHQRGIIIWQVANGNLVISTTADGGFTWTREIILIGTEIPVRNIDNIRFAANGQILVTVSEYTTAETSNNPAMVFQSTDFGKSWRMLH